MLEHEGMFMQFSASFLGNVDAGWIVPFPDIIMHPVPLYIITN